MSLPPPPPPPFTSSPPFATSDQSEQPMDEPTNDNHDEEYPDQNNEPTEPENDGEPFENQEGNYQEQTEEYTGRENAADEEGKQDQEEGEQFQDEGRQDQEGENGSNAASLVPPTPKKISEETPLPPPPYPVITGQQSQVPTREFMATHYSNGPTHDQPNSGRKPSKRLSQGDLKDIYANLQKRTASSSSSLVPNAENSEKNQNGGAPLTKTQEKQDQIPDEKAIYSLTPASKPSLSYAELIRERKKLREMIKKETEKIDKYRQLEETLSQQIKEEKKTIEESFDEVKPVPKYNPYGTNHLIDRETNNRPTTYNQQCAWATKPENKRVERTVMRKQMESIEVLASLSPLKVRNAEEKQKEEEERKREGELSAVYARRNKDLRKMFANGEFDNLMDPRCIEISSKGIGVAGEHPRREGQPNQDPRSLQARRKEEVLRSVTPDQFTSRKQKKEDEVRKWESEAKANGRYYNQSQVFPMGLSYIGIRSSYAQEFPGHFSPSKRS